MLAVTSADGSTLARTAGLGARARAVHLAVHAEHVPARAHAANLLGGRTDRHGPWHRKRDARSRVNADEHLASAEPGRCYQPRQSGCRVQAPPARTTALTGASPRATRWMFSAMTAARASIMPSVQPDTCGVMSTFGRVWNGRRDGSVGPPSPCG